MGLLHNYIPHYDELLLILMQYPALLISNEAVCVELDLSDMAIVKLSACKLLCKRTTRSTVLQKTKLSGT